LKLQKKELTYKSSDTEEIIDKVFYRQMGYYIALACSKTGITPNALTISSIIIGSIAGFLFYSPEIAAIIAGIILFIIADIFDSADGQLARLTGAMSKFGRILDGVGGNIIFVVIYISIAFKMIDGGATAGLIILLTILSMYSHSVQSAMADYYRNIYLYFREGRSHSEIDSTKDIKVLIKNSGFFKKIIYTLYFLYTSEQEIFSVNAAKLISTAQARFPDAMPADISELYTSLNKKNIKYYNLLTVNTRVIVLFISLLLKIPIAYLILELTAFNILLIYVILIQKKNNDILISKIINYQ
jgi:phosphatidylglycerophosphate synthase